MEEVLEKETRKSCGIMVVKKSLTLKKSRLKNLFNLLILRYFSLQKVELNLPSFKCVGFVKDLLVINRIQQK